MSHEIRSGEDASGDLSTRVSVTHRSVLRISVPMMFAYLAVPLIGMVDLVVVGTLGQPDLVAGLAIAATIFDVLLATFGFLRFCSTSLAAQALGAARTVELRAVLAHFGSIAALVGLTVVVLHVPIGVLGFDLMGVSGGVATAGDAYFAARVWGVPFALLNFVVTGWLLGIGRGPTAFALQVMLSTVNIALCATFVLALDLGVAGAGYAATVAEALTTLAGLIVLRKHFRPIVVSWRALLNWRDVANALAASGNVMIRSLVLVLSVALFTRAAASFGPTVLAANAILLRIYLVNNAFLDGIANAAEQLIGQAVGAGSSGAFTRATKLVFQWGLGASAVLIVATFAFGASLIDAVAASSPVAETAKRYVGWVAILPIAGAVAYILDGIFIGANWTADIRNLMVLSAVVFVGANLVFAHLLLVDGLWLALVTFLIVRSVLFALRLPPLIRRTFPLDA